MDQIHTLSEALSVDKDALDEELIRQPQLFYQVSELVASLTSQRDSAKERLSVVDAGVAIDERTRCSIAGEKVTERMVDERTQTSRDHAEAITVYLELKRQVDLAQALRESFLQRSFMLRDLASLTVSGYFMSSSVSGARSGEYGQQAYKEGRKKLAVARRKVAEEGR